MTAEHCLSASNRRPILHPRNLVRPSTSDVVPRTCLVSSSCIETVTNGQSKYFDFTTLNASLRMPQSQMMLARMLYRPVQSRCRLTNVPWATRGKKRNSVAHIASNTSRSTLETKDWDIAPVTKSSVGFDCFGATQNGAVCFYASLVSSGASLSGRYKPFIESDRPNLESDTMLHARSHNTSDLYDPADSSPPDH